MRKSFPTLLIFSSTNDPHVQAVVPLINSKTVSYICDLSQFGITAAASLDPQDSESLVLHHANGDQISFRNVETIWWRRPQPFTQSKDLEPSVNEFIVEEQTQFWSGL